MRLDPHLSQGLVKTLLWTLTGFTLLILIFIIADIAVKGLPQVTPAFLSQDSTDMGRAGGIFPTIVATAYITLLAILLASPLGVGTAIYLTEYTREGWATRIIRFGSECLAGVPSIILGLFGFVLFVLKLGFGWSVLSGGLTLAIMVLPAASSGIITAIILGMGRAIGETMAVIMVAGNALQIPTSLLDPVRTLTSNIALELGYAAGRHREALFATGIVLFIIIMILNLSATLITRRR